jgi:DNA invertase Pin-like site-specific DNA recombinase
MLARASSHWPMLGPITSSAHGKLLLTVLGGLAEFERELIRARLEANPH